MGTYSFTGTVTFQASDLPTLNRVIAALESAPGWSAVNTDEATLSATANLSVEAEV